jgi:hypothetical protein
MMMSVSSDARREESSSVDRSTDEVVAVLRTYVALDMQPLVFVCAGDRER